LFLNESGINDEQVRNTVLRSVFTRYTTAIQEIFEDAPYRTATDIVYKALEDSILEIDMHIDPSLLEQAVRRFKNLHLEMSTPENGAVEVLETLKNRKKRLGVLTNSFAGHATIILTNLELIQYFSSIVDCGDVNAYKPMRAPFEKTLRDLDTDVSKALYVGDEYYADMVGGKSVGMTTVWINHRQRSLEDMVSKYGANTTPDFVLNSITEFAELL
jgi:HAD superfamily hydrolase (TIGR01549 family)